jgi:putative transposase
MGWKTFLVYITGTVDQELLLGNEYLVTENRILRNRITGRDGSQKRRSPGRPTIATELESLVVRLAQEHRPWGYDRIVRALANLGYTISDQTVGDLLKRHGIPPAPERKKRTTWKE